MATCMSETETVLSGGDSEMLENNVKVVLIGESGSGKTSLLGLFKNYERQRGKDFQPSEIRSFAPPRIGQSMSSVTTISSTHRVDIGEFMIDIIDTPGLGDTRGEEQNKENIANIIAALKEAS